MAFKNETALEMSLIIASICDFYYKFLNPLVNLQKKVFSKLSELAIREKGRFYFLFMSILKTARLFERLK